MCGKGRDRPFLQTNEIPNTQIKPNFLHNFSSSSLRSPIQSNPIQESLPMASAMACSTAIMASSKPLLSLAPKPTELAPKPKPLRLKPNLSLSAVAAAITAAAATPLPSVAAEIEKAALFDFNLTLPIMMVQFLVLMVALDKIYFTPLGSFMDQRDAAIKEKLGSVQDTSSEVKELEEQAAAIMRAAKAEIAAALNAMKKETQAELEVKLAEGKAKVDAELREALAKLDQQKADTIKALDSQIAALSQDIVSKVLPL